MSEEELRLVHCVRELPPKARLLVQELADILHFEHSRNTLTIPVLPDDAVLEVERLAVVMLDLGDLAKRAREWTNLETYDPNMRHVHRALAMETLWVALRALSGS